MGRLDEFRVAIHGKMKTSPCQVEHFISGDGGQLDIIDVELHLFRLFGFLDNICVYTQRPGAGAVGGGDHAPWQIGAHDVQWAFYSGYLKRHGLKYQHLLLPNGLYGSVWGSSMAHNDSGILNLSGLVNYLREILEWMPGTNMYPALYADGSFTRTPVIVGKETNGDDVQRCVDVRCNTLHQLVDLAYGEFFNKYSVFKNGRVSVVIRW